MRSSRLGREALPALVLSALAAVPLLADESRIPIYQPTAITQPGYYIVTRDFTVATGNGIDIQSDQVTLDLNGHTISITGPTSYGVNIADGYSFTTIRNGTIAGGSTGVYYQGTAIPARVRIERLMIRNVSSYGVFIALAEEVDVLSCTFNTTGFQAILIDGAVTVWHGRIANNHVSNTATTGAAVQLGNAVNVIVEGNDIRSGFGIDVLLGGSSCRGIEFSGNTMGNTGFNSTGLNLACPGSQVVGNVFSQISGTAITLVAGDCRVVRNVVTGTSGSPGHAVTVNGSRNLVEDNQLQGSSGCGINFGNTNSHVYRNNVLRGNAGGGVCGSANTDAGGNVL